MAGLYLQYFYELFVVDNYSSLNAQCTPFVPHNFRFQNWLHFSFGDFTSWSRDMMLKRKSIMQIRSQLSPRGSFKTIKNLKNELLRRTLSVPNRVDKLTCLSMTLTLPLPKAFLR